MPQALASRPHISQDVAIYLEIFFFLSGFRAYGMSGPQPIALSEIVAYANLIGYTDRDDTLFLLQIVRACDSVYLKKHDEDQKAGAAAEKAKVRTSGMRHK